MLRTRNRVRTAALRAEIFALRATVSALQAELVMLRELSAAQATAAVAPPAPAAVETATPATAAAAPAGVSPMAASPASLTLALPLMRLALSDVVVDRGRDTALTEIVLGDLPERPLLDPRTDRDAQAVDVATPAVGATATERRRTA